MYVLILTITLNGYGVGVSQHDYSSLETCKAAGVAAANMHGTWGLNPRWACVKK